MEKRKSERAAYHEAGHAVARWHCRVVYRWVEIFDHPRSLRSLHSRLKPKFAQELKGVAYDPKAGGRVKASQMKQSFTDDDDILMCLSGPVCENIRYREPDMMTYINQRFEIMAIEHEYGNVDFHWDRVKAFMKRPEIWACVEAVAKELVIRKRISCAEVAGIIEKVFDERVDDKKVTN